MKRFLLWLLFTAVLFAGVTIPTHLFLSAHPRRIAVAVDTSFEMQAARQAVRGELAAIGASRYALFSLLTDKVKVHGWQENLDNGAGLAYYGPRDVSAFADTRRYPELADADSVILITGGRDTSEPRGLRGLRVVVVP